MTSARDLVVRLHEAISRRDPDAVSALFHPEARFRNYLDEGQVIGQDGARAFYERLFEMIDPDIDLLSVKDLPQGRVQAELQVSVHDRSGHLWSDSKVIATYVIADGLIQSVELEPEGG
jgi:hypothetical protein